MAEAQNRTDELEQRTAECRQTQEESLENVRDPSEVEILLEEAFKCSPMGMAIFDNDMRYVRINETLAKFNGVPAREHIGKTIRDIIPNLADVIEPIMRRVLDTGEPVINASLSGSIPPEFGALLHWSHHWSPLKDKDGQVIGVSAIIEEITDRKRAEERYARVRRSTVLCLRAASMAFCSPRQTAESILRILQHAGFSR